jgi:hypothetical protein
MRKWLEMLTLGPGYLEDGVLGHFVEIIHFDTSLMYQAAGCPLSTGNLGYLEALPWKSVRH